MRMQERSRSAYSVRPWVVRALALPALLIGSCETAGAGLPPVLTTEVALQDDQRQLWSLDATWSRNVIVSSVDGLDDRVAVTTRLERGSADMGAQLRRFYDADTTAQITALLDQRVAGFEQTLAAIVASDDDARDSAAAAWRADADDLALALSELGPTWDYYDLFRLFDEQNEALIDEAEARVRGDFAADVAAHDAVERGARAIADAFTESIAGQFPDRVSSRIFASRSEHDLHVSSRVLWDDHVSWMRFFVIDRLAGSASLAATTTRLVASQDAIGDSIRQLFGGAAADELTALLHDQVDRAGELTDALADGDDATLARARSAWYANASDIARFYGSLGERGSLGDLEGAMNEHADLVQAQMVAREVRDWDGDVAAYDAAEAQVLELADLVARTEARNLAAITPTPSAD